MNTISIPKNLITFFAVLYSFSSFASIIGYIDAVTRTPDDANILIRGWACDKGKNREIDVHLYFNGPAGGGGRVIKGTRANNPSEAAVARACGTRGIKHRYSFIIPKSTYKNYVGKKVYVHGISVSRGSNLLLSNSGKFTVPNERVSTNGISHTVSSRIVSPSKMTVEATVQIPFKTANLEISKAVEKILHGSNLYKKGCYQKYHKPRRGGPDYYCGEYPLGNIVRERYTVYTSYRYKCTYADHIRVLRARGRRLSEKQKACGSRITYKTVTLKRASTRYRDVKRVLSYQVPTQIKTISGLKTTVKFDPIKVHMDQNQRSGRLHLPLIGRGGTTLINTGNLLNTKPLYIRHDPRGTYLYTTACYALPGTRIENPYFNVKAEAKKKFFWFVKISVKVDANLSLGAYEFQYMNFCAAFKTSVNGGARNLKDLSKIITAPNLLYVGNVNAYGGKLTRLNFKKMRVKGNWLFNVINFVPKIFGYNLKRIIANYIQRKVRTEYNKIQYGGIGVNDIENGAWVQKMANTYMKSKYKEDIIHSVASSIESSAGALTYRGNFSSLVSSRCSTYASSLSRYFGGYTNAKNYCLSVAKNMKTVSRVVPFYRNSTLERRGCYSRFAPVTGDAPGCAMQSKYEITTEYDNIISKYGSSNLTAHFQAVQQCITNNLINRRSLSGCGSSVTSLHNLTKNLPTNVKNQLTRLGFPQSLLR